MKYSFTILCAIFFVCTNMFAEMSDIEQTFHDKYGIIDMTSCKTETNILRTSNNNCINITDRGQEYAPLFIPNENDSVMNVRVNLIFIQKDDGTGNFQQDNAEHQTLFDDVVAYMNQVMSSLVLPGTDCFLGTDADIVHDMRVRFVDQRYYVKNSRVWNNDLHVENDSRLHPDMLPWYLDNVDDSLNNTLPNFLQSINIYFTEDSTIYHHFWEVQDLNDTSDVWTGYSNAACSQFPSYSDWNRSSRIHIPCQYSKFWWMKNIVPQMFEYNNSPWESEVRNWLVDGLARGLLHELGHSFYLYHPHDESTPNTFYPSKSCGSSIMTQAGSSPRNFLPPAEIGRLFFHTMTTNLQRFIPQTTYLGKKSLDTTISLPRMRLYHSLEIASSANISMPCDIIFPAAGNITIQTGGVLSVEGAKLQSIQGTWGGIIVQSGGQLILSNTTIGDYNIIVKSGGSLVIRNDLTITGEHHILIEDGGYLCVNTDASINLIDGFSSIIMSPNAFLGCPSCNENCTLMYDELINTGNGRFITYYGTDYVQDTIITSNYMATGNNVMVGYDVTNTKPVGGVIVQDGGNLRIMANDVILTRDVEIKQGGTLQISQ